MVSVDIFYFVLIWFGFNPSTYQEGKIIIYGFLRDFKSTFTKWHQETGNLRELVQEVVKELKFKSLIETFIRLTSNFML